MIEITNVNVSGWEPAVRGMRNPLNSWNQSDSYKTHIEDSETGETADFEFFVGDNDLQLMKTLVHAGTDHSKFMRFITVTMDINAPLYWWKEFDTYKVGTVANSCSTMHKIHSKEFTLDDFSTEHLVADSIHALNEVIVLLNMYRNYFNSDRDPDLKKMDWWQMIQLLPSSYNQKRTVQLNYAVLRNIYHARKSHKLDEWHDFCDKFCEFPYKELIIL